MDTWIANSYAKINLGLYVTEQLSTGYHAIETGFGFIDWSDRFTVRQAPEYKLSISDDDIPTDDRNLITQAIQILEKYVGLDYHYRIDVEKRIPAGGGLGGGSSNAALILRMINKMESLGLTDDELIDLSRKLGADVPFFIKGNTGIGTGIGHQIEPADIQPSAWIVTVTPDINSSTKQAYEHCIPNPGHEFSIKRILEEEPVDEWRYLLINDLEPPVLQLHPHIGDIKDQLYELGADYASMSGSGSSVYAIFEQEFVAKDAYKQFLDLEYRTNITPPDFSPDYGIYRRE